MKKNIFILSVSIILFSSCMWDSGNKIEGNGNVTTVNKTPGDFTGVELHGNYNVYLTVGNPAGVKIEADENLQQHIKMQVVNGVLKLETTDDAWLKSTHGVKVYLTSPEFRKILIPGAGSVTGQSKISSDEKVEIACSGAGSLKLEIDAPEVSASVSGAGSMNLSGETKKLTGDVSGLGSINAMNLLSEESDLTVSGVGNIEANASVKLKANISGTGSVKYKGDAQVEKTVSGLGSVSKAD
jgi:carbon monoxide dehydrogenase subunit G